MSIIYNINFWSIFFIDDHLDKHWAEHKVKYSIENRLLFFLIFKLLFFFQAKYHPELDSEDSTEEEARRKALFANTHEMIQKHNSDPKGKPQMAHNHISAMVFI